MKKDMRKMMTIRRPIKRNTCIWGITLLLVTLFWSITSTVVRAEEESLGYTVDIIKPDTQIDGTVDYFNIQTRPGETQTIQAVVKSLRTEPVTINIFTENAITSESAQINYTDTNSLLDKSLSIPLSDMVSIATPEVTVANYEEKVIDIQITPPKESYEGIRLGDLAFQLQAEKENESSGVASLFAYRIGLMTMEEDREYADSKTIKLVNVTPNIHRGKKTVLVRLQNPEPKILADFNFSYKLSKKGSKETLKEASTRNHNMAPNSNFNFPIDLGVDQMKAGDYVLNLSIDNAYGEWEFNETFNVSDKQAKEMNDETAFKLISPMWVKFLAVTLAIASVVSSIGIFYRQRKWQKRLKDLRKKKKKKRGRK